MKKINFGLGILACFIFAVFTGCDNFGLTKTDNAAAGNEIKINLGNTAARTITAHDFTATELALVSQWNVQIVVGSESADFTVAPEDGVLTVSTDLTGTGQITVSGSYADGDNKVAVEGTAENVNITAGLNVSINVDTVKTGTGSFEYTLSLDPESWGTFTCGYIYQAGVMTDYTTPGETPEGATVTYGNTTAVEKTNFSATLTSLTTKETVELSCTEYYETWTCEYQDGSSSTSGEELQYIKITGTKINAGTYQLAVTAKDKEDDTRETVTFSLPDSIVEIFGDTETPGEGTSYYHDSEISWYYATTGNSGLGYNGLTPKSRINIKDLADSTEDDANINVFVAEAELENFKDWDIWKDWTRRISIGIFIDGAESDMKVCSNDFYMGYYQTLFADDSTGSSSNDGLSTETPLSVDSVAEKLIETEYDTVVYTVTDTSSYDTIATDLAKFSGTTVNIILNQAIDGNTEFPGWSWDNDDGPSYTLTLNSGITTGGFTGDEKITSLTLGDSYVSTEDGNSFAGCTALTTVKFGSNVQSLGNYSFGACSALTEVEFGSNIISIGDNAFRECTALTSVTFDSKLASIGSYAFNGCSALMMVEFDDALQSIGNYAFGSCTNLMTVTFNNNLESIGESAFNNCENITSLTFDDALQSIGDSAFGSCTGLSSVTFGSGLRSIGEGAFSSCSSITSLTFNDALTTVLEGAFSSCSSLTSVTFGEGILNIGAHAFSSCDSLTSITLPANSTAFQCYASDGTEITSDMIETAKTDASAINKLLTTCSIERCQITTLSQNVGLWSGKVSSTDSALYNFKVPVSVTKFGITEDITPELSSDISVYDYAFDADKNLYLSVKDGTQTTNPYQLLECPYSDGAYTVTEDPIVTSANVMHLYYDNTDSDSTDKGLLYIQDSDQILKYNIQKKNYSIYTVSNTASNFAAYGNWIYTFEDSSTSVTQKYTISGSSISETESEAVDVLTEAGITDSSLTTSMTISDITVDSGYLYVLVKAVARVTDNGSAVPYSRGAVLKFAIDEDGALTYENKLGLYETNTAYNVSSDTSITTTDFLNKYFTGPVKFIATEPKKLVIADDGIYWVENGNLVNVNRIVTVDLTSFAFESETDVPATFDKTGDFTTGGSQFIEITFSDNVAAE